jgi:uncharacterized protein YbjT (DUF2867 family)
MRVMVAGATGLVGRALLSQLAADTQVSDITALVRRVPTGSAALPARVRALTVDFSRLGQPLPAVDWAFCCLGTTIKVAGSQAAFQAVDQHAVLAFARAARAAGARGLAVVSALGADAQSSVFYNRIKGQTEAELRQMDWPSLVIARPSLLMGNRAELGQATRPMEQLAQRITPAIGWLLPGRWRPIEGATVARALRAAAAQGAPGVQVLESETLARLGR